MRSDNLKSPKTKYVCTDKNFFSRYCSESQANFSIDRWEAGIFVSIKGRISCLLRLMPVILNTIFSIHQGNSSKKPNSNLS